MLQLLVTAARVWYVFTIDKSEHRSRMQHDADAFHRRVFRHCYCLWIKRTIDLLFLRP
jgi:hypothetical protein